MWTSHSREAVRTKACDAEFWHHSHEPASSRSVQERLPISLTPCFILQRGSSGLQLNIPCTPHAAPCSLGYIPGLSAPLLPVTMTSEALLKSILLLATVPPSGLLLLLHPSPECLSIRWILGNTRREAPGASSKGELREAGSRATDAA